MVSDGEVQNINIEVLDRLKSSYSRVYSSKSSADLNNFNEEEVGISLRLSSRQISLHLS
ncbi:hypothetical protein Nepgr_020552 [Nepenthes gracilis]|uniref:Uncharacterized protein n=1 Tax=Nepenthes gracilis TaxID=150966 RepID=A0AAD3SYZ5_NEPGR|nr:hypothetical protein Nepgr_020552 [Nepenthes gracilis]